MPEVIDATIVVPRSDPAKTPIRLELMEIYKAESRVGEMAFITPQKAPELQSVLNLAMMELSRMITEIATELEFATQKAERIKSIVILDKAIDILKSKGLTTEKSPAGSADMRDAVVNVDPDYSAAMENVHNLKCCLSLLKGKEQGIKRAYYKIDDLVKDKSSFAYKQDLGNSHNPNSSFGKPKY